MVQPSHNVARRPIFHRHEPKPDLVTVFALVDEHCVHIPCLDSTKAKQQNLSLKGQG